MHPTIGDLISSTYYGGELVNSTRDDDGLPLRRVVHGFTEPTDVRGRAIVWVDVPWCRDDPRTHEHGPARGRPRFTNPAEAIALRNFLESLGPAQDDPLELAVLSPYNQQTAVLRDALRGRPLAPGLRMKPSLHRGGGASAIAVPGVHTVDSFQGNQADVIAVSLVRNNTESPAHGLGFLDEPSRLNVLLSRAERLLVLAGSWDFFQVQVSLVDADDRDMPLWHLRHIVTTLDGWFSDGTAALVPGDLTGLQP
jgi:superfamily I DNA and/or RNA helicase